MFRRSGRSSETGSSRSQKKEPTRALSPSRTAAPTKTSELQTHLSKLTSGNVAELDLTCLAIEEHAGNTNDGIKSIFTAVSQALSTVNYKHAHRIYEMLLVILGNGPDGNETVVSRSLLLTQAKLLGPLIANLKSQKPNYLAVRLISRVVFGTPQSGIELLESDVGPILLKLASTKDNDAMVAWCCECFKHLASQEETRQMLLDQTEPEALIERIIKIATGKRDEEHKRSRACMALLALAVDDRLSKLIADNQSKLATLLSDKIRSKNALLARQATLVLGIVLNEFDGDSAALVESSIADIIVDLERTSENAGPITWLDFCRTLLRLSSFDSFKVALGKAGAVPALMRVVLSNPPAEVLEVASGALANLMFDADNIERLLRMQNAVPHLWQLLQNQKASWTHNVETICYLVDESFLNTGYDVQDLSAEVIISCTASGVETATRIKADLRAQCKSAISNQFSFTTISEALVTGTSVLVIILSNDIGISPRVRAEFRMATTHSCRVVFVADPWSDGRWDGHAWVADATQGADPLTYETEAAKQAAIKSITKISSGAPAEQKKSQQPRTDRANRVPRAVVATKDDYPPKLLKSRVTKLVHSGGF
eukprot:c4736_g1_i1.p1 GENE.c4736_g1_i1~~c4736_g1_i1.p1  ORF type:complete len:601 (+),score=110.21 c4736_g1_i1:48-1850(+)